MAPSDHQRPFRSMLDPETRGRRWIPFALVTLAALASAFLPGGHVEVPDFLWSLAALAVCVPLLRFGAAITRGFTNLAGALAYLTFVGLLVTAQGGVSRSGLFTLALLPVLWIALYSPRWKAIVVTTAASVELMVLSLMNGEDFDVVLRKVVFWLLITAGLTISVRQLRDRFRTAISQRDDTIADVTALGRTLQTLASLRDPDEVLKAATRTACELTSGVGVRTRRCSYFVINGSRVEATFDDAGHKAVASWPVSEHPQLALVVETLEPYASEIDQARLGSSIRDAVRDAEITHGAWIPVLLGGHLHGVIGVAGRDDPIDGHLMSFLAALARVVESALDIAMAYSDLEALAGVDPLTGLLNRRGLESASVADGSYVVISADLDDLKEINDTLGHGAGDAALERFADVLRSSVRQGATVARIGGDEFLIILDDATQETGRLVTRRILDSLSDFHQLDGLCASFGFATGTTEIPLDVTISRADEAMYLAKKHGGMRATEWSPRNEVSISTLV
jgi:diguanylate cyclase (GGDEF)-like protein